MWNVSKYEVFSGLYFSAFARNSERYFISLCIHTEYGKIRTRKNSVFGHFSRSESYNLRVLSQGYSHKFQGFYLCKNHKLFSTNTMIQFLAIHKSSLRVFWFFQRKYWPEMGKTELIWRWTTTTIITKTTKTNQNNKSKRKILLVGLGHHTGNFLPPNTWNYLLLVRVS